MVSGASLSCDRLKVQYNFRGYESLLKLNNSCFLLTFDYKVNKAYCVKKRYSCIIVMDYNTNNMDKEELSYVNIKNDYRAI